MDAKPLMVPTTLAVVEEHRAYLCKDLKMVIAIESANLPPDFTSNQVYIWLSTIVSALACIQGCMQRFHKIKVAVALCATILRTSLKFQYDSGISEVLVIYLFLSGVPVSVF